MSTLVGEKLAAAVSYNNGRGLDPKTIKRLQKVVGTKVDGELGPNTARAVFQWQGTVGLAQDGKIGPKTIAAIMSASDVPAGPRLGVWVDDVPNTVLSKGYFDNLEALGFSTLAIMVHHTTAAGDASWRPRWNVEQLEQLRALAEPRKMSLVLTTWPVPNSELLAAFAIRLPPLLLAARAVALEVDTEGNWLSSRRSGYANMNAAALALVDTMRKVAAPTGAQLELTTYPFHAENGSKAKIAPHMDRVFPQAYSVGSRANKLVGWDDREGPHHLQKFSAERAKGIVPAVVGQPKLALGLAAYDQNFEGHSPREALTVALDTAISLNVAEVRYWSSKWIIGSRHANSPVDKFLLERANAARAGAPRRLKYEPSLNPEMARIRGDDDAYLTRDLEDLRGGVPFEEDEAE